MEAHFQSIQPSQPGPKQRLSDRSRLRQSVAASPRPTPNYDGDFRRPPAPAPPTAERPSPLTAPLAPPPSSVIMNSQPSDMLLRRLSSPAKPAQPKQQQSRVLQRQFLRSDDSPTRDKQLVASRLHKFTQPRVVLAVMACFVFGLGLLVDLQTLQANHSAKAQVSALAKSDEAPPSESKPSDSDIANYQVAPTLPKYLAIPSLGVKARVRPLGTTSQDALQAPNNIYDAGWYEASARPADAGSNGAMVIDGHVHGPTKPGIFANLNKLSNGSTIKVTRGDNTTYSYVVRSVKTYKASDLNVGLLLASIQPGEPGLNLVTCGGPFDRTSGQYTQRIVVSAVRQS